MAIERNGLLAGLLIIMSLTGVSRAELTQTKLASIAQASGKVFGVTERFAANLPADIWLAFVDPVEITTGAIQSDALKRDQEYSANKDRLLSLKNVEVLDYMSGSGLLLLRVHSRETLLELLEDEAVMTVFEEASTDIRLVPQML